MRTPKHRDAWRAVWSESQGDSASFRITSLQCNYPETSNRALLGGRGASSPGTEADPGCVHRRPSDAVWRRVSAPPLFPTPASAPAFPRGGSLSPTQQRLYGPRDAARAALPNRLGAGTDRDHRAVAAQRRLPNAHRAADISRSYGVAAFSPTPRRSRIAQAPAPARPPARPTVSTPSAVAAGVVRSGLDGLDPVRPSGEGASRLQSAEARPALVPSAGLLRGADPGLLARRTPRGRRAYRHRGRLAAAGLLREVARHGASNTGARRCGVLRLQSGTGDRSAWGQVCHRRPTDASVESPHRRTVLCRGVPGSGGRRVRVPAAWLASPLSLCGGAQSAAGRGECPDDPAYRGPLHLPCLCNQLPPQTSCRLSILQRSGRGGEHHQGAQGRLPAGQNPHQPVRRQRGVFPSPPCRIQFGELDEAALPPAGVSDDDVEHAAPPALHASCRIRTAQRRTDTSLSAIAARASSD